MYEVMTKQLTCEIGAPARSFGTSTVRHIESGPRIRASTPTTSPSRTSYTMSSAKSRFTKPLTPHYRQYKILFNPEELDKNGFISRSQEYDGFSTAEQRGWNYMSTTTARKLSIVNPQLVYCAREIKHVRERESHDSKYSDSHRYAANGVVNHNIINFPLAVTHDDVDEAHRLASDLGHKGLTISATATRGAGASRRVRWSSLAVYSFFACVRDMTRPAP